MIEDHLKVMDSLSHNQKAILCTLKEQGEYLLLKHGFKFNPHVRGLMDLNLATVNHRERISVLTLTQYGHEVIESYRIRATILGE